MSTQKQHLLPWAPFHKLVEGLNIDPRYEVGHLRASEIAELCENLRSWFPEIAVGEGKCYLEPSFYENKVQLEGVDEERDIALACYRCDGKIIGISAEQKNHDALTLVSRMGALDPKHRSLGLAQSAPIVLERMARAIGAAMVYYHVSIKSVHQQKIAEDLGYVPCGIIPASNRRMFGASVKRVFVLVYCKVLCGSDELYLPTDQMMTPRTKELWGQIFGPSQNFGTQRG